MSEFIEGYGAGLALVSGMLLAFRVADVKVLTTSLVLWAGIGMALYVLGRRMQC